MEFIANSKIYNKERKEGGGRGKRVVENLGVSRCDIYKMWLPYGAAPPQPRTVFNYGNFALIIIVNKALLGYYLKTNCNIGSVALL